tara:strand:+ start:1296 stop:1694 length:399 start_codon:yes stop_codon:yes gene_type:complete
MFSKQQLEGILLSHPKTEINVSRDSTTHIGYRVRLKVSFRGDEEFLQAVKRTLLQSNIEAKYKAKEHSSRPRPILTVSGKKNLHLICKLVPAQLPDSKKSWGSFRKAVALVDENKQHTSEGLDKILKLKGLL